MKTGKRLEDYKGYAIICEYIENTELIETYYAINVHDEDDSWKNESLEELYKFLDSLPQLKQLLKKFEDK